MCVLQQRSGAGAVGVYCFRGYECGGERWMKPHFERFPLPGGPGRISVLWCQAVLMEWSLYRGAVQRDAVNNGTVHSDVVRRDNNTDGKYII